MSYYAYKQRRKGWAPWPLAVLVLAPLLVAIALALIRGAWRHMRLAFSKRQQRK